MKQCNSPSFVVRSEAPMLTSLALGANKLDLYPDLRGLKGYIGDSLPIFWDTPPVKPVYIVVRGATSISDGRFKHFQQK